MSTLFKPPARFFRMNLRRDLGWQRGFEVGAVVEAYSFAEIQRKTIAVYRDRSIETAEVTT